MLAIGTAASLVFTGLIWLLSGWLADVPHAPDAGASWYYWKLIEPTAASRLTAWGFYLLHQVSFWALNRLGAAHVCAAHRRAQPAAVQQRRCAP